MIAARPQKITFREMRETAVRGVLVHCADYHCTRAAVRLRCLRQARSRGSAGLQLEQDAGRWDALPKHNVEDWGPPVLPTGEAPGCNC
jgi:hypothetical protein